MDTGAFDPRQATLASVLASRARESGHQPFVTELASGEVTTYGELDDLTRRLGSGLLARGVPAGAHVGVLMDNSAAQLVALFGLVRSGFVAVPVNSAAKGQLLAYFLGHSDCVALIVDEALLPRVAEVAAHAPKLRQVIAVRPAEGPRRPAERLPGSIAMHDFQDLLTAPAVEPGPLARFPDLAMLMYTSGTTGPSKAIMFSQAQVVYWGADVAFHHEYCAADIAYVYLPLFHGNALLGATMGSLMAGARIALARRFSASQFWRDVRESRATVFNGVGSVANFLWSQPSSPRDREHGVKRCHFAPVPTFAQAFEERFGMPIMSAYGLTDYCLATSYNTQSRRDKLGSAGLPRRHVALRIVDECDLDVPAGTPGEIVLRNDMPWGASLGYYKAPEASFESRRNLWFHTGDRGCVDADGYVWYTDRLKDSIRRRGENISAFEVEEAMRAHPAVIDVAVYALRSDLGEDEVAASLVLRPDVPWSPEQMIVHCSRNLSYFMVPRYLEVVDAMPTTLSQKIEKYKLRERAEANRDALWDRERAGVRVTR